MKKMLFIYALLIMSVSLFPLYGGDSVSPGELNNSLARTFSLSDTFFNRYDRYSNQMFFGDFETFVRTIESMSLDAVWYTGYNIQTDQGFQQEGNLGRAYGDLYTAFCFDKFALAIGLGGYRYGVFLTGIDFSLPSADPVDTPIVTDFSGTQTFQDVYTINLGFYNLFWVGGYVMTNTLYDPSEGGTLQLSAPRSIEIFPGARANILGLVSFDVLFSEEGKFQTFNWSVDPMNIALYLMDKPINPNISLSTGVNWKTLTSVSDMRNSISWDDFVIPLQAAYKTDNWRVAAGFTVVSPSVKKETGSYLTKIFGEADYALFKSFEIGVGFSFYNDNAILGFGDDSTSASRVGAKANVGITYKLVNINLGWKYNYVTDIADLPEVCDRNIFYLTCKLLRPFLVNFRTAPDENAEDVVPVDAETQISDALPSEENSDISE